MRVKRWNSGVRVGTGLGLVSIIGTLLLVAGAASAATHPAGLFKLHAPIELTGSYPTTGPEFGRAVAAGGSCVAVGAPLNGTGALYESGAVYLYSNSGRLVASLNSPNPSDDGAFGIALAMTATTLVVGTLLEPSQGVTYAGTAYVYSLSSTCEPTYRDELLDPNPQSAGNFGYSVAVSGSYALVGAPFETASGYDSAGNAYLFDTDGQFVTNFTSPNPEAYGNFGDSVALSGSTAYVGAPSEGQGGHVYMIKKATSPTLESGMYVLTSPNPLAGGDFGGSLSVSGRLLIIAAVGENEPGVPGSGNVYAFNASTGIYTYTLVNPSPASDDAFGGSVRVSGSYIVVGSSGEEVGGSAAAGSVTVYNEKTGAEISVLTSPNFQVAGSFGGAVALNGGVIVVGADYEAVDGVSAAGHAYLF
jgi:hypothetical protein